MIGTIVSRGIVMRNFVTAAALTAAMMGPAGAQDGPIEGVIQGQVEAFLAGDVEAAFGYASSTIQGIFGSPERFGRMVEEGYPMVWRPSEVRYLERRDVGSMVIQKVLMRDAAGVPWVLDYQMIEGPGGWVIDGVQVERSNDMGA